MIDDGRKRLGRGLAALLGEINAPPAPAAAPAAAPAPAMAAAAAALPAGDTPDAATARAFRRVPIEHVAPNPRNPRRTFVEEDLTDLTASIKEKGIVSPILVRPSPFEAGRYEIIAGERRWRAAQAAQLHDVPVLVREVDDREALALAIIENVQRADLNPIEEALGYEQLTTEFGLSQSEIADGIGKSRAHVANTVRLLKLPEPVRAHVVAGRLSAGHARALLTATEPEALAERAVSQGLSVRDVEALAADPVKKAVKRVVRETSTKDADTRALEKRLSDGLGLKVAVEHRPTGAGEVRIRYGSLEQLDEIIRRLEQS
ncbi:ParB/RepB/Spo0J family partition protein [Segnochrobactraceae bacterium EtOH-i3]